MAASSNLFPAVLLLLLVYHSKAATVPGKVSSAHSRSGQEMTPHELDLADLSLPPEVITEALFTQTDFLQDQLEQCEERVRNNLKGNDKAETDGIEDYEDDDDDDDGDNGDDDEDDLNKKIAQMAVKAFSQFRKDDAGDVTHQESEREGEGHGGHVSDHSAASSESGAANSHVHGKGQADDAGDVKGKKKEEDGEEYIVYEYEEAADSDTVQAQEGQVDGQKDAQKLQDGQDPHEDSRHEPQTKDDREGLTTHDQENPVTGPPSTTQRSDPARNSADSDAEEPQPPPEEVNLSSITTNNSHSQENSHNSDSAASQEHKETTQDPASTPKSTTTAMVTADTDDSDSSGNGDVTAAGTERTDSGNDKTTASVQRSAKSERKDGDNNSEDSRVKRSLSLDRVLMNQAADRGTHKDVHRLTFGKTRIRRQTSPREEVRSWLMKHAAGHVGRNRESPVNNLLRSLLIQTQGGSYPFMHRQKTAETILEHDFTKTDEETVLRDVIKMTGNAKTYDMVQMAEKFLDSLRNSQPSHQRLGDQGEDLEVRRLLAPPTPPSGEKRVRRRRGSRLGPGLSPERYVPLIEQLVERLNYLQHSVRVCHMLLPPQHLPANFTVQA